PEGKRQSRAKQDLHREALLRDGGGRCRLAVEAEAVQPAVVLVEPVFRLVDAAVLVGVLGITETEVCRGIASRIAKRQVLGAIRLDRRDTAVEGEIALVAVIDVLVDRVELAREALA